jgi:hypothetical protein
MDCCTFLYVLIVHVIAYMGETIMKKLAVCVVLCLGLTAVCGAELSAEMLKDWGADCATFELNETKFGMTFAEVTNASAEYAQVVTPESPLKVVSFLIVSVAEDRIPIGETRSDVTIFVVKNVYFNQDDRAVAIEMKFANLDGDKTKFVLSKLDNKYEVIRSDVKRNFLYKASDNIEIRTEVIPTDFVTNEFGRKKAVAFGIVNLYYHKTKYKEALKKAGEKVIPAELI